MNWFEGFDEGVFEVNGVEIYARYGGDRGKAALLLLHGFCEDYRASSGIDLVHDRESRARGDKVDCDILPAQALRGFFA